MHKIYNIGCHKKLSFSKAQCEYIVPCRYALALAVTSRRILPTIDVLLVKARTQQVLVYFNHTPNEIMMVSWYDMGTILSFMRGI